MRHCALPTKAGFPRSLTLMEPPILLSSSRYQSKHFLSNRERCGRIIQNCTLNCERIFSRIQWNFPLNETIAVSKSAKASLAWPHPLQARRLQDPTPKMAVLRLLRLGDDSKIWFRRFPAFRIPFLRLFVRDRAGDDNVLSG